MDTYQTNMKNFGFLFVVYFLPILVTSLPQNIERKWAKNVGIGSLEQPLSSRSLQPLAPNLLPRDQEGSRKLLPRVVESSSSVSGIPPSVGATGPFPSIENYNTGYLPNADGYNGDSQGSLVSGITDTTSNYILAAVSLPDGSLLPEGVGTCANNPQDESGDGKKHIHCCKIQSIDWLHGIKKRNEPWQQPGIFDECTHHEPVACDSQDSQVIIACCSGTEGIELTGRGIDCNLAPGELERKAKQKRKQREVGQLLDQEKHRVPQPVYDVDTSDWAEGALKTGGVLLNILTGGKAVTGFKRA